MTHNYKPLFEYINISISPDLYPLTESQKKNIQLILSDIHKPIGNGENVKKTIELLEHAKKCVDTVGDFTLLEDDLNIILRGLTEALQKPKPMTEKEAGELFDRNTIEGFAGDRIMFKADFIKVMTERGV